MPSRSMTSVAGTPPDRLDLIPGGPLNNMVLREAVRRVAENVAADGQRYPAIGALLAKQYPRLVGLKAGAPLVQEGADIVSEVIAAVRHLDRGTLERKSRTRRNPQLLVLGRN